MVDGRGGEDFELFKAMISCRGGPGSGGERPDPSLYYTNVYHNRPDPPPDTCVEFVAEYRRRMVEIGSTARGWYDDSAFLAENAPG